METLMSELSDFRREKDEFFGSHPQSPLTPGQQSLFEGLSYYDENPPLALAVNPEPFEQPETIHMQTSTGDVAEYQRWARIHFEIDGEASALTIYRDAHGESLFLPFQDANAGGETYGAGRYLDVHATGDGRLLVDFNYAYNPYCAYNERWSCPIPPAENRLSVAIEAGEKVFPNGTH
jgi:uncharacterized protein (DUF1684 family)